jgi:hypothetical protein
MMPIQSIEGSAATDAGEEARGQKPKTLPCRYCQKRFRRLEHVSIPSLAFIALLKRAL